MEKGQCQHLFEERLLLTKNKKYPDISPLISSKKVTKDKKKSPRREKPKACAYSACTKGTLNIYNSFKSMFLSFLPLFLDWAFPVS